MLLFVSLAGFLLFCILLKWQVWHVRLIVALAALPAPVFAWSWSTRPMRHLTPLAVLALVVGLDPVPEFPAAPPLGSAAASSPATRTPSAAIRPPTGAG